MPTPWDVYIDERKVKNDKALGFLIVPNTASFMRKLYLCRNIRGSFRPHEVHWSNIRGDTREIAQNWIYRAYQHHGTKFYLTRWESHRTKEYEILRFLDRFTKNKKLAKPFNVVTFLDFDDEHSAADIQNSIQRTANIARCYHLDSRNNDCLQCCDLLMNATIKLRRDPLVRSEYADLKSQVDSEQRLSCSKTKSFLAGHLAQFVDQDAKFVYDFMDRAKTADQTVQITPPRA